MCQKQIWRWYVFKHVIEHDDVELFVRCQRVRKKAFANNSTRILGPRAYSSVRLQSQRIKASLGGGLDEPAVSGAHIQKPCAIGRGKMANPI